MLAGSVGGIVGGVAGGLGGGLAGGSLADVLTERIFKLPRADTAANAYRFFGLHASATAALVSAAYMLKREAAQGNKADLIIINVQMQIIRMERGG